MANKRFPKETVDLLGGGKAARLDNFRSASLWAGRRKRRWRAGLSVDKGQRAELDAFVGAVRTGGAMPIALDALVAVTDATLAVGESLTRGDTVKLGPVCRKAGWYARRLMAMSPAEVAHRVRHQAVKKAWRRSWTPDGPAVPAVVAGAVFRRPGPAVRRAGAWTRRQRRASSPQADGILAGSIRGPRRGARRPRRRRTGSGIRSPAGAPRTGATPSASPPRRGPGREHQADLGAVAPPPPDHPGCRLLRDRRGDLRPSGWTAQLRSTGGPSTRS